MAKVAIYKYSKNANKKRKGVHSKNASKSQSAYKKLKRGQGKYQNVLKNDFVFSKQKLKK